MPPEQVSRLSLFLPVTLQMGMQGLNLAATSQALPNIRLSGTRLPALAYAKCEEKLAGYWHVTGECTPQMPSAPHICWSNSLHASTPLQEPPSPGQQRLLLLALVTPLLTHFPCLECSVHQQP